MQPGLIGLGRMGASMVRRLLRKGQLLVFGGGLRAKTLTPAEAAAQIGWHLREWIDVFERERQSRPLGPNHMDGVAP